MNKDEARKILDIYGQAWVDQDHELILSIFTPDATYDDPRESLNSGHESIKNYWITKVIGEQKDISFDILNIWIDGDTVIAEWHADFIDTKRNIKIDMIEVAIFTVRDGKFSSLREYYKNIKTEL